MTTVMIFTLCALGLMVCVAIALGCLLRATEAERWKAVVELCTLKGRYEDEKLHREDWCRRAESLKKLLKQTRDELQATRLERDGLADEIERGRQ